jgi:mono/diheme cytochrome c family protein
VAPGAAPEATPATAPATTPAGAAAATPAVPAAPRAPDSARGGRLYDSWRTERKLSSTLAFDSPATPEPDGKGGPNGNGTLNDGRGRTMLNSGHDYRLRSFFGWDLRGKQGLSGPKYHGEKFVLEHNLLEDTRSFEDLRTWLAQGDEQLPAYGQVLNDQDLDDLAAFLVESRDGRVARPEQVFQLDASTPGNYRLRAGADAARGAELFGFVCSDCHGNDGRKLPFDAGHTLGTFARERGYEAWFKIQNGLAGSPMKGQIVAKTGADAAQDVLDLLAALCDRKQFPRRDFVGVSDAPDGDPRCGKYLK